MTLYGLLRHLLFAAALSLLSALLVWGMIRFRVVLDHPDARKAHLRPIPKGGGVGIVVAFLVGVAILYRFAEFSRIADPYFRGVILAATAIAGVAFLDDIFDWPFIIKLAAQLFAALLAVGSGLFVREFHLPVFGTVDFGWLGSLATLFWILFVTNAMNFIDGLDGLAGGVALIAAAFLAGIAASQGGWFVYFASLLLVGGLAGFLPFNFPRARIFMGDVGSQFCGFVLAVLGVAASRFEKVEMSFTLVPMLLFAVLFDVALTLARRLFAGKPLTVPHREHLYQLAHRAGLDARAITLIYWAFTVMNGVCAIGFVRLEGRAKLVLLALPLIPQIFWLAYVLARARKAGV